MFPHNQAIANIKERNDLKNKMLQRMVQFATPLSFAFYKVLTMDENYK